MNNEKKQMTVGELIERLKDFAPNLLIRIDCPDEYYGYYLDGRDVDYNEAKNEVRFYGIWSVP